MSPMKFGNSGLEKLGWLKRLKNSARSCKITCSVSAVSLKTEKLNSLKLGPCKELRPRLPKCRVPGTQLVSSDVPSDPRRVSPSAGRGERGQVQELRRIVGILHRADHIRTVKSFACSGIVSLKFVVQMPRLSVLQVEHSIEAPAILQLRQSSTHLGELVSEVPGEASANVEAGVPAIARRIGAVLRLRLVGLKVLEIAGGIDGMRPDEVRLARSNRASRWCAG